jgi:hypothetical protein
VQIKIALFKEVNIALISQYGVIDTLWDKTAVFLESGMPAPFTTVQLLA